MSFPRTLSIRNLEYVFPDGGNLFSDICLNVAIGETVAVFGGNGSGKSTLLKCIAGIESLSNGEICDSENLNSEFRKSIGLVMQNPEHQMIAPTVEEEIALGLEFRGVHAAEIERRVEGEIERFALQSIRNRSPETLSGGQMQRVALAAIVVVQPAFLLLDEPDSLLDAPSRREFMEAVSCIRKEHGILWACADADRLPNADRYCLLSDGRLKDATVDQIRCIDN